MRAPIIVVPLVVLGCEVASPAPFDGGRFDVREATTDPRDATVVEVSGPGDGALVDVTLGDVRPIFDAVRDGAFGDLPVRCLQVANEHAVAVREAQRCLRDEDCDARICETLCCACEVFVNRRTREADLALVLVTQAADAGCTALLPCPRVPCPRASRAVCSSEGRCVTLREPSGDAGGPWAPWPDASP